MAEVLRPRLEAVESERPAREQMVATGPETAELLLRGEAVGEAVERDEDETVASREGERPHVPLEDSGRETARRRFSPERLEHRFVEVEPVGVQSRLEQTEEHPPGPAADFQGRSARLAREAEIEVDPVVEIPANEVEDLGIVEGGRRVGRFGHGGEGTGSPRRIAAARSTASKILR